jgi:crotonobetainyl-CoA:carnitine CoA-transferase CaiB-like acyl-CoA transferase
MSGPLDGVRVLDFSTLLPGPFATRWLADLGADVIRVVAPGGRAAGIGLDPAVAATLNRNKRSIGLDLKHPASREPIARLLARADVLVEQFRPGVMQSLGLGYDDVRARVPSIVYCSLTGFGQSGPYRRRAGHDLTYLAMAGVLSYSGREGEPPVPQGVQMADFAGAFSAVAAILAALYRRARGGSKALGEHLDVAMCDAAMSLNVLYGAPVLAGADVPRAGREVLNGGSLYDCYRTRDGRYLSVGSLEPKFLAAFFETIGRPDLAPRASGGMAARARDGATKQIVADAIAQRTLAEWTRVFEAVDACVEPVLDLAEVAEHPHTRAREMVVDLGGSRQFAHPVKYSAGGAEYRHAGRADGAETDDVLRELGFTQFEIASIRDSGAVR